MNLMTMARLQPQMLAAVLLVNFERTARRYDTVLEPTRAHHRDAAQTLKAVTAASHPPQYFLTGVT